MAPARRILTFSRWALFSSHALDPKDTTRDAWLITVSWHAAYEEYTHRKSKEAAEMIVFIVLLLLWYLTYATQFSSNLVRSIIGV